MKQIDWANPKAGITSHFTVGEALLLPRWKQYHRPTYTERANIQILAGTMEAVREIVGKPIAVHCWIRPVRANLAHPANTDRTHDGEDYNALVRGWQNSMHIFGRAVDFHVKGYPGEAGCREIRKRILPHLDALGLRMEDVDGGWVHLDNKPVAAGGNRFFKP